MYNEEAFDKVVLKIFEEIDGIKVDTLEERMILTELQMNLYQFLKNYKQYEESKKILNEKILERKIIK